jgi:hypothetical protein
LDRTGCVRDPRSAVPDADLTEDAELGFQVVSAPEVEHIGVTGLIGGSRRVGERPVPSRPTSTVLDRRTPAPHPGCAARPAGNCWPRCARSPPQPVGAGIVEVAPAYDHAQIAARRRPRRLRTRSAPPPASPP